MIQYLKSLTLRQRANGILGLTAVLYCFVFIGQFFYGHESWYQPLYWAVQSALIGSVADWFAVTALFRKPLGFPYHTALIPRNKDRLINGVIKLVETKMLTKERCKVLLSNVQFVPLFEKFLLSPEGQRAARLVIHQGLHLLWKSQTNEEWAQWGAKRIRGLLQKHSLVPVLKHVLLDLCEHNRYEGMVVQVLNVIQERINHPAMVTWLTAVVAEEAHKKKRKGFWSDFLISMSEATDVVNYHELAQAIVQEAYAMLENWKRPNSPERTAWLRQWVDPIRHIEENREVCDALDEDENGETPAQVLVNIALELWTVYGQSEDLRNRIEDTLHNIGIYVLEQGYDLIETIIRQVLGGLSTDKFIYFIESKVEDDLSWIRINGAIVGAIAGLVVWTFLEYVYMPLWQQFIG
ncbi:MAG: DUF445 domain-containing protein [Veillonella sp.]|nr:DUF445 domain-containing protein [Veillonella sp.]